MASARQTECGAITIILTVILFVLATLIILFAASYSMMQEKTSINFFASTQAYQAAEAGLEYAINYLQKNSATILANPVGGYIPAYSDVNTSNVTLANNSKYTFVYSNPVANNYKLILITSTGTNADGTATRVISQEVQFGSLLISPPSIPITSKGNISIGGNSTVTNTQSGTTVKSGGTVSVSGSGETVLSGGVSSTAGNIKSDIQQNVGSISSLSNGDLFSTYFGVSMGVVKSDISHYYSNSSATNYSSTLNNMTGTSIWIDQTSGVATINGSTVIGSAANPVLLIVNGDLDLSGNVTIYGFVYVIGQATTEVLGNVSITGGLISTGDLNLAGHTQLAFSSAVLSSLQNQSSMSYYAKVPGTWKDF